VRTFYTEYDNRTSVSARRLYHDALTGDQPTCPQWERNEYQHEDPPEHALTVLLSLFDHALCNTVLYGSTSGEAFGFRDCSNRRMLADSFA
jgi:hypothetical protein